MLIAKRTSRSPLPAPSRSAARAAIRVAAALLALGADPSVARADGERLTTDVKWPFSAKQSSGADIDYEYWKSESVSSFKVCAGAAAASKLLSSAERQRVRDCMAELWKRGPVCAAPTAAECTNLHYHQTWCGRVEYAQSGATPGWLCAGVLRQADADYAAKNPKPQPIALPDVTYSMRGRTQHYLERAEGVVAATPGTAYTLRDRLLAPNTFIEYLKRQAWNNNGQRVASCEEYAYEKYYDFSRLDEYARGLQYDPRAVNRAVFEGLGLGGRPLATSDNRFDFRDKGGGLMPTKSTAGVDTSQFHFNYWLDAAQRTVNRALPWNVFQLDPAVLGSSSRVRETLLHLVEPEADVELLLDFAWHRKRAGQLAQMGYLDEQVERLKARRAAIVALLSGYASAKEQEELSATACATERRFGGSCGPGDALYDRWAQQSREAQRQADAIRAELAEGVPFRCDVTTAPGPCDWAPSDFARALFSFYTTNRSRDRARCEKELGTATFTEQDLDKKFFDPTPVLGASSPTALALRRTYLDRSYTDSPRTLETYMRDVEEYRRRIYALLPRDPGGSDSQSTTRAESKGSVAGILGSSVYALEKEGAREQITIPDDGVAEPPPCKDEVFTESDWNLDLSLVGLRLDSQFAGVWGADLHGFQGNLTVSGEYIHEPCYTPDGRPTTCDGLTGQVSTSLGWGYRVAYQYPIQIGYFTVWLRVGAAGNIGLGATMGYDVVRVNRTTGVTKCPALTKRTSRKSIAPRVGIDGFAEVGVALAIAEVGVSGSVALAELSFPSQTSVTTDSDSSELVRSRTWDVDFTTLRGTISIYVGVELFATMVKLFQLDLIKSSGVRFNLKHGGDPSRQNRCLVSELKYLVGEADRTAQGCTCILRNRDNDPECQP